ncbi:MAG: transglutaminase family protein, partial [Terriglobales bacterium]
ERLQVKLSGFMPESRYVVTCNGRRVRLHPIGETGEAVAGIRYRARRLSDTLHPTIPVHAPLVFDIVDRWKKHSIGRCTYHVTSPDGRPYTTRPSNATEAEQRRSERFQESRPESFQESNETLDSMMPPEDSANPIFPMTLDLRLPADRHEMTIENPELIP